MKMANAIIKWLKNNIPTDKKLIRREIKGYFIITLCLALYGLCLVTFVINSNIVSGGVNGMATLLYYASGHFIPVGVSSFIINLILLLIGFRVLGNAFGIKTIYAIFMLSAFVVFWQGIITEPVLDQDPFLSAVIAGVMCGMCIGTAFNYGGSTGGTDIVALIVSKYRNVSPGRVILYCDVLIISSSFIVFYYFLGKSPEESFRVVLYGFVFMVANSYTLDLIVLGAQSSVQMLISSKKHEEIAHMISTEMKRGVTIIDASGYYSKAKAPIIFAVVRKYEMQNVLRRVRDIDPDAFTSITKATGVYGRGFEHIK